MKAVSDLFTVEGWPSTKEGVEGYGYDVLLDSFEYEIVASQDFGSYQGDTAVLFRDGTRYGWLTYGWGSCSGCDAFEAATTIEDLKNLQESLHDDIHWEPSAVALGKWMQERDWEGGEWAWHEEGYKEFAKKCATALLADDVASLSPTNSI